MTPALSVVVVTPRDFGQIRRTVRHLREQDVASALELVLVAPSQAALADRGHGELDGFGAVRTVTLGTIPDVDRAAAHGMLAASAPVVAVVEDHAFVQRGWAQAIIEAYRDAPWVAVGSTIENANPRSATSWANLLLGHGWWIDPSQAGEMADVPGHNGSYRRSALAPFGDDLPDRMGRDGDLHDRLRAQGGRMYLAADARVAHVNPSRLTATADLRLHAGRLYGATRAAGDRWSPVKRLLYALASPLIPLVRLRRLHADHLAAGRRHHELLPRILPALLGALGVDAAGQAVGYLRGPGRAAQRLAVFEMDRRRHLVTAERKLLDEPPPLIRTAGDEELPSVSVVVPAFREADRLRACLKALAVQDYPPERMEVVVVDDGSPVPLDGVAHELSDAMRVSVHRQANAGPASARNAGARRASGTLVAFTDDDCEPAPGWLLALAKAHLADPGAMLGGAVVNDLDANAYAEATQMIVSFLAEWLGDDSPRRFFASNNVAVGREAFLDAGGFDTSFPRPGGEDRELCERWRRAGGRLVDVPDALVRHVHPMGPRGLLRQHWNYGRGAYEVHRRGAVAAGEPMRLEPLGFYLQLMFGHARDRRPLRRAIPLSVLLVACQAANAAGFGWEWWARRR